MLALYLGCDVFIAIRLFRECRVRESVANKVCGSTLQVVSYRVRSRVSLLSFPELIIV